jgi:hypothetical protein
MYIKIENCENHTERIIDYPGNIRTFLALHSFGIYEPIILKPGAAWALVDRFAGHVVTIITKPGKREIAKYLKEAGSNEIN